MSRSRLHRLKTEGAVLELSRGVYRKAGAAETAHLDLLAVSLRVPRAVEIARIEIDDGVEFAVERIGSAVIREGDLYEGMRSPLGDPRSRGHAVSAVARRRWVPDPGVSAGDGAGGKLTTALSLGDANTRERDWADIWRLTGRHELNGSSMYRALRSTADYRGVELRLLSEAIVSLPARRAGSFRAWRKRQGVDGNSYPDTFADLVADVVAFADPLATEDVADQTWNPDRRRWEVTPHTRGAGLASPAV